MNFNCLINSLLLKFLVFHCLIYQVVFGELSYNEYLKENKGFALSELNSTISESGERTPWFLNVPLLPVIVATSNSIPEGSCKNQLLLYLNHLKNGTLWATEMFDSSAKVPYGVFNGFTVHLGSFDQCERINAKVVDANSGKIEEIRSKYCLVDVKFKEKNEPTDFSGDYKLMFDPQDSAWEAIREKGDFRRWPRYHWQMALCFPAQCQLEDIEAALREPLDKFEENYSVKVTASISPLYCSSPVSREAPFSNYEIIFCLTFLSIIIIVGLSTIVDMKSDKKQQLSLQKQLLYCFSARKNFNEIFNVNNEHRGLDTIHFVRVFISGILMSAHRQLQFMFSGSMNGLFAERVQTDPIYSFIHNVPAASDGMFSLGGLLLSYSLLKKWNESGKLNYTDLVITRLVRLLPLFMFVTFGYATVFYRLGSGPFWEVTVGFNKESCSSYWWTNLFFINNYFGGTNKCILQSWYLAVDFQCWIIGLFLITAFCKMPRKIGYTFFSSILIFSTALTFYIMYKNDVDPIFKSLAIPNRPETSDFFLNYYSKTELRFTSYSVGLIFGAIIYDSKRANWRLSKTVSQFLYLSAFLLTWFAVSCGLFFTTPNLKMSALAKGLYASLSRLTIAYSSCVLPLVFTIGNGLDFYYKIMTASWFQRLSRISYSIYITQFIMFLYEFGSSKSSYDISFYILFKCIAGDAVYTVCLGFFFAILIEYPFKNVGNLILKRKTKNSATIQKKEK
ncbi:O-acyltransferase like protein-like [Leptopilina heterotoma]|uniref:O-acyltransferase like protein-like n=1 Tax=Leptopilina heterotoma TaxID=63436 RepID=UPI001CA7F86B|nr:O-acyltransferase like protein-like [Leptopilina heterotoma]